MRLDVIANANPLDMDFLNILWKIDGIIFSRLKTASL
jgi:hypothetical protein